MHPPGALGSAEPPPAGGSRWRTRSGMAAMAVLGTAANVLNYASSLIFSRILEPVGFGELTSLLALSVILAVPLGAAQTVIADRVAVPYAAGDHERVRYLIRYALGHVAVLAVLAGVLYAAAIPLIVDGLDIRQPGPAIALAPLVVLNFLTPVALGALQGMERYLAFGMALLAIALSRLAFGVPWALAGGGAGGAIGGQAFGLLAVTGVFAWTFRRWLIGRGTGAATRGMRRRVDALSLSASGAFIGFAVLSNFDLVLARVFLDNHDAGIYAAMATVAKVTLFLPSAIAVILVPRAAISRTATGSGHRTLQRSAAVGLLLGAACIVPAALAPGLVVDAMFGGGYDEAVDGVLPAAIGGAALATVYLVCVYAAALADRRWTFLMVAGVIVQTAAIGMFHDSPTEVAWAQAGTALAVLAANEVFSHSLRPRRRRLA